MRILQIFITTGFLLLMLSGCAKLSDQLTPFEKNLFHSAYEQWDNLPIIESSPVLPGVHRRLKFASVDSESFQGFKFRTLKNGYLGTKSHHMDLSAEAFLFDTGKSYYVAFKLPELQQPYRVRVQSFVLLHGTMALSPIFYPVALFLDESFNPVRLAVPEMKQEQPYDALELNGFIEIESDIEKYMIIMTTDEVQKHKTEMLLPIGRGDYGVDFYRIKRGHSPEGVFRAFVEEEQD